MSQPSSSFIKRKTVPIALPASQKRDVLFNDTRWDVVTSLRAEDESEQMQALGQLWSQYSKPLKLLVHRMGPATLDPDDVVSALFRGFVADPAACFKQVGPKNSGRFRSFLVRSLRNQISDDIRRLTAAKRGSGVVQASLEEEDEDGVLVHEPASRSPAADIEYDRAVGTAIIEKAFERLLQECDRHEKGALGRALLPVLQDDATAPSYREIGARLGMCEGAVRTASQRLREKLRHYIVAEVRKVGGPEAELDDAKSYLRSLLSTDR